MNKISQLVKDIDNHLCTKPKYVLHEHGTSEDEMKECPLQIVISYSENSDNHLELKASEKTRMPKWTTVVSVLVLFSGR